jgi:hypothetical protein
MRMRLRTAALLALLAAPAIAQDRMPAADRPDPAFCPPGGPLQVWLLGETTASDCDATGGGTIDALCCCVNNAWAACAAGGSSGNSFETIDLPAGTDPVAESSADTLTVTCPVPMICTGTSAPDAWAITWSGVMPDSQIAGSAEADEVNPTLGGQTQGNYVETVATTAPLSGGAGGSEGAALTLTTSMATGRLIGRTTGGAGVMEEITPSAADFTLSSGALSIKTNYGQYDPDRPPTTVGTGGWSEDWTGNAASQTWAWFNPDAATHTIKYSSDEIDGEVTGDEFRGLGAAAATNLDQTFSAKVWAEDIDSGAPAAGCYIGVICGGTLAAPTRVFWDGYVDAATDLIQYFWDTDYDISAGTTSVDSISTYTFPGFMGTQAVYLQFRYTDSSRKVEALYSADGVYFWPFFTTTTGVCTADPTFWLISARDHYGCRFEWARLRTDANRNDSSE